MNKHFLCLAFILAYLIYPKHVISQNYAAVRTNASYFFKDAEGTEIIGIRIDSVKMMGNDTYYYNFTQPQYQDTGCWNMRGSSWLGNEIVEKPDGSFNFVVYPLIPGDSNAVFMINTLALPGDFWTFYTYHESGSYIEATLDEVSYLPVIDIYDSVKMISLKLKDLSGQVIPDPLNDQTILLSKDHGLIRLPQFDAFPYFPRYFELVGKTSPDMGIVIPTYDEIFDYNIGDEFHTIFSEFSYDYVNTTISTVRIVTAKEVYAGTDSTKYTYDESKSVYKNYFNNDSIYISNTSGEVTEVIRSNIMDMEGLVAMPDEAVIVSNSSPPMAYTSQMELYNGRAEKRIEDSSTGFWLINDCWSPVIFDGCPIPKSYITGLGGPYYSCYDFVMYRIANELVYYKKGTEANGTPMNCDSLMRVGVLESSAAGCPVTLSPNPAKNLLFIRTQPVFRLPAEFVIMDLSGRLLKTSVIDRPEVSYDISFLPSGVYLLTLRSSKGERYQMKLIRQ